MNEYLSKILPYIVFPVIIYIIFLGAIYFLQARLLYFPDKIIENTPDVLGMEYTDFNFKTEDGLNLHGWFIKGSNPEKALLFCHGNAGNISHRLESIQQFVSLGFSVLIFDYRGYGKSEGSPDEKGTYKDAMAAHKYVTEVKGFASKDILVFGRSLGGSIAAWLAKETDPGALVVESAFTSVPDIAGDVYPIIPVKLVSRFSYSTIDYIKETSCPVLVIHSTEDDLIPFKHGKTLYESAGEPKKSMWIKGGHNDGFLVSGRMYIDGISNFLEHNFYK